MNIAQIKSTSIQEARPRLSSLGVTVKQQDGRISESVDFTMLDFILDFFIKYLVKGIINERNGNSPGLKLMGSPESHTPMHDELSSNDIMIRKKNMIEVMSDLMQLLSQDSNIRLFDDLRFIDTLNQLINFMY